MKLKLSYVFVTALMMGISSVNAAQQPVKLADALQQQSLHENLTQEQARQAILKMAGEYKVDFRFEELYSLKPDYKVKKDDLSSGYETVVVLENTPNKVSLQHILVADGHVVKHWRQDWEYEPTKMWSYIGDYRWKSMDLKPEQSKGKWLQTVWQVDDSPRYAGLGTWTKDNGAVEWVSNETYRPLPRREHTTRNDYDVIIGINRHALTATGWVHEQDNIKFDTKTNTALARELGVNQYNKVEGYDFKAAYDYWKKNAAYWSAVRDTWANAFNQNQIVALKFAGKNEKSHFSYFNDQAKSVAGKTVKAEQLQTQAKTLLNQQLVEGKLH
ncbi:hypothetical protein ACINWC323_3023 [Acinetobacter sp. WC-323]|uniref:DUF6607 family protein n=1 Tax=Acinetobacter sp. WC-323 TaxID=903918 RepID=UPI00029DD7E2|nr:DUF6607 family protein [Acinetobacter sp. WC-323]EKU56808.1 hypothetical protein ACINWC323_3023 [Acinetobacter sp. WC-323]